MCGVSVLTLGSQSVRLFLHSVAAMEESGEESSSSSQSSSSDSRPLPGGTPLGAEGEEEGEMVYFPPHFPQRKKSGSDFSPHSESSEEEEQSSSSEESREAPPIQTYAPPPTHRAHLLDESDVESGSGMESRHTANSHRGSIPYQPVPTRRRPAASVNYKQFYTSRGSSESGSGSDSGSNDGGWRRQRKVGEGLSLECPCG